MQELNTIFPYGLNSRIDIHGIHDAYEHVVIQYPFIKLLIMSKITVHIEEQVKKSANNDNISQSSNVNHPGFDGETFIRSLTEDIKYTIQKHCRNLIMNLKLAEARKLIIYVSKLILSDRTGYPFNEHLLYMVKDICLHRLVKKQLKLKDDKDKQYIMVTHVNGLIDDININKLIHSKQSYRYFPGPKDYILKTGVTYKYSHTIRSEVVNYNGVAKNINCRNY